MLAIVAQIAFSIFIMFGDAVVVITTAGVINPLVTITSQVMMIMSVVFPPRRPTSPESTRSTEEALAAASLHRHGYNIIMAIMLWRYIDLLRDCDGILEVLVPRLSPGEWRR